MVPLFDIYTFRNWYIFLVDWSFCYYKISHCVFCNFLCSEIYLSAINITVPAFSWLMLAWCIFFHHFTFNLPISLNLKWAPCRQHTDDTHFKIQFVNLCLLIAGLRSFKMNTMIDRWRFKSYTCFFVYCLFISVLHSLIFF